MSKHDLKTRKQKEKVVSIVCSERSAGKPMHKTVERNAAAVKYGRDPSTRRDAKCKALVPLP